MKLVPIVGALLSATIGLSAHAGTLEQIKARGELLCGVSNSAPGFSKASSDGTFEGMDIELCRAVATAVLGSPKKVKLIPLTTQQRFTALQSGSVDLLIRNTTWSMTRDATQGAMFVKTMFYDGQGFIVPKSLGIKQLSDLNGATICVQSGTTAEKSLADYFRSHHWKYNTVVFETTDPIQAAFLSGRCDAYTQDINELAAMRASAGVDKYEILPDMISKSPLAPVVRRGDDAWFMTVRWILNAIIEAEELGITSQNVEELAKNSTNPEIRRFVGKVDNMGKMIGLDKEWSYRMIRDVGNYGELYARHFGEKSHVKLPRGPNNLWTHGGLIYAEPML